MVANRQKEAKSQLDKIRTQKMRESIGAPIDYKKKKMSVSATPSAASIRAGIIIMILFKIKCYIFLI